MLPDSFDGPVVISIFHRDPGVMYTFLKIAIMFWLGLYITNWISKFLYDKGYDIFNIFKKKKKSRKRS